MSALRAHFLLSWKDLDGMWPWPSQAGGNPEEPGQGLCMCIRDRASIVLGVGGELMSDGPGQALTVACGRTPSHLWEGDKDPKDCSATQRSFLGDMTSYEAEGRRLSWSPHHSLQSPQLCPQSKGSTPISESLEAPGLRASRRRWGHMHRLLGACSSSMWCVPSHWAEPGCG